MAQSMEMSLKAGFRDTQCFLHDKTSYIMHNEYYRPILLLMVVSFESKIGRMVSCQCRLSAQPDRRYVLWYGPKQLGDICIVIECRYPDIWSVVCQKIKEPVHSRLPVQPCFFQMLLLNRAERQYPPQSLTSCQPRRWASGHLFCYLEIAAGH